MRTLFFHKKNLKAPRAKAKFTRGFTLFELLVAIAIFTFMTTALLVKNSQYRGTTAITNLSYEVALKVREAQAYGINVKSAGNLAVEEERYEKAFGIHLSAVDAPSLKQLILFTDIDSAAPYFGYTATNGIEDVEILSFRDNTKIYKFCATLSTNPTNPVCSGGGALTKLDIMFKRPFPDAFFAATSDPTIDVDNIVEARIYLVSPSGVCKLVQVGRTGQISVPDVTYDDTCTNIL